MDLSISQIRRELIQSYTRRKSEEERVWEGYELEVNTLTGLIEARFRGVAEPILKPRRITLGRVEVRYNAQRWKNPDKDRIDIILSGGELEEKGRKYKIGEDTCAYYTYGILTSLFSKSHDDIRRFVTENGIDSVSVGDCDCGSDHK